VVILISRWQLLKLKTVFSNNLYLSENCNDENLHPILRVDIVGACPFSQMFVHQLCYFLYEYSGINHFRAIPLKFTRGWNFDTPNTIFAFWDPIPFLAFLRTPTFFSYRPPNIFHRFPPQPFSSNLLPTFYAKTQPFYTPTFFARLDNPFAGFYNQLFLDFYPQPLLTFFTREKNKVIKM